jgi:50S ribosomal protein L16 3-hydroxylase
MVAHAARVLGRIRWTRRDVGEFLGRYLTTPKPHVVFFPPRRPMPRAAFARRLRRAPVALDRRTLMLYRGARIYVNGEALVARPALRALADRRRARLPSSLAEAAYGWYLSGYLHLEQTP